MTPTVFVNNVKSRKERRKEERILKKGSQRNPSGSNSSLKQVVGVEQTPQHQRTSHTIVPTTTSKLSTSIPKSKKRKIDVANVLSKTTVEQSRTTTNVATPTTTSTKQNRSHKDKNNNNNEEYSAYQGLNPDIVAALRHDDEEIAFLESKLLSSSSSGGGRNKKNVTTEEKLRHEYAKQEGYGDDFIDFLDDLDTIVETVVMTDTSDSNRSHTKRKYKTLKLNETTSDTEDDFSTNDYLDASSEMDDVDDEDDNDEDSEELVPMKEPARDDSDDNNDWNKMYTISHTTNVTEYDSDDDHSIDILAESNDMDDHETSFLQDSSGDCRLDDGDDDDDDGNVETSDRSDTENDATTEFMSKDEEPDHDVADIYQPSIGEDIYGNRIDTANDASDQPQKYIPPHLRKGTSTMNSLHDSSNTGSSNDDTNGGTRALLGKEEDGESTEQRKEMIRELQRLLNSALNRLSEGTIVSVVQTISQIYSSYPTADINDVLWVHTQNACVVNQCMVMTALIPIYVSTIVGIQVLKGDSVQLIEYLLEKVVTRFHQELERVRNQSDFQGAKGSPQVSIKNETEQADITIQDELPEISKEISNLALIIGYMYSFGVVHCTLLYDIIRHLIESCCELDVEVLLLLLNHCGRTLRSDDPNALKEIMTSLQHRSMNGTTNSITTSRAQYLMNAMMDLKKNKRRRQDQSYADQTLKLRKVLGHIKSNVNTTSKGRVSSDASLRITLRDILDVNVKGRWWKVGASWAGSDPSLLHNNGNSDKNEVKNDIRNGSKSNHGIYENDTLLRLAAKYRMNTDTRRTIFCIIMGGADYEDCFEKLVRSGMLKNRSERDTVRVITECCGNESSFNPYYAHLAARICEFQPQCKFTFQLAYWDIFKQLEEYKPRKVANLAKLLFHLVANHNCLKLNVIKTIDIAAPEELSEMTLIFVTIFLSSILEYYDNPDDTFRLFKNRAHHGKRNSNRETDDIVDTTYQVEDGIQASLTVFLVQILKASPKYQKGSKFRTNLKAAIQACDTNKFI
jgi:nucleolar MIF4G domain-containing protein 1